MTFRILSTGLLLLTHATCYFCLVDDRTRLNRNDFTISNAIDSVPNKIFAVLAACTFVLSILHGHMQAHHICKTRTTHVGFLGLLLLGLGSLLSLKLTDYNPDQDTGLLRGLDGIAHYALATIGIFFIFLLVHLTAQCTLTILACKVSFGGLLAAAMISAYSDQYFKLAVAFFENAALLTFGVFLVKM